MNFAHLHLLLNHFPIIGTMIATGLFVASFFGKNDDLRRTGLMTLVAIAALSIPTFVSGLGAQIVVRGQANVSAALIQRHEGSAILSLVFMGLTGALALGALRQKSQRTRRPNWTIASLLFLSLLTVALMARTGNTGGEIRHSEIRGDGGRAQEKMEAIARAFEPDPNRISEAVLSSKWWWASIMNLHFVGLILIVGTIGILNLRIIGFLKNLPIAPLRHLIPWALAGLAVNVVTGMIAFLAQPGIYVLDAAFWLKILALMLLGVNAAVFYLSKTADQVESVQAGEDAPTSAKFIAVTSLLLWFLVIALGRYIHAFIDTLPPLGLN